VNSEWNEQMIKLIQIQLNEKIVNKMRWIKTKWNRNIPVGIATNDKITLK